MGKARAPNLIDSLVEESRQLDYIINTLRFLGHLNTASGGDVTVRIKDIEVTIDSTEIDIFISDLTRILESRVHND
jgi:hypothetical protein